MFFYVLILSIDITVDQTPINHAMFNEAQTVILRLMAVDSFKVIDCAGGCRM